MQKRGSGEFLASVLIVGLAISLFTFVFLNINQFSSIKVVQRSIDTSKQINFEIKSSTIDDNNDNIKILLENKQDLQISSFEVRIYTKDQIDSFSFGSLDGFSSNWFEIQYIDPSNINKIEIIPQTIVDNVLNIHIQSKKTINQNELTLKNSQILTRDFICAKCGNHKVPPSVQILATIEVYNPSDSPQIISDYFPKDFLVLDSKGGNVISINDNYNKISWDYTNGKNLYTYTILSPQLTSPPTKYDFQAEFITLQENYSIIVSDPTSSDYAFSYNNLLCTSPCIGTASYTTNFNDLKSVNDNRILTMLEAKVSGKYQFGPSTPMFFNLSYPYQDIDKLNLTLYCNQSTISLENLNISIFNFNTSTWRPLGESCNITNYKYYYYTICPSSCSINDNAKNYVNSTTLKNVNIRFSDNFRDNTQSRWNIDYINLEAINVTTSIALSLSNNLTQGISWIVNELGIIELNATGNEDITLYNLELQTVDGNADIYIKANDSLYSGFNIIGLGNETFSYNYTSPNFTNQLKIKLTTNFVDNKIGSNLINGTKIHLKFYLDVPSSQAPGLYSNQVFFKAVDVGANP